MRHPLIFLWIFVVYFNMGNTAVAPNTKILKHSYVMPKICHGRFGDQLLLLLTTLWVSEKYNIPFMINSSQPFPGLSIPNQYYVRARNLPNIVCESEDFLARIQYPSIIHIPYGYKDNDWSYNLAFHRWDSLRSNIPFLERFRSLIRLKNPEEYDLITPPKNLCSVAVHIRFWEPGCSLHSKQIFREDNQLLVLHPKPSVENGYIDILYPLKFPPLQYYINQLNHLPLLFPEKIFYVFLFSDYPEIQTIANLIVDNLETPEKFQIDWRASSSSKSYSLKSVYEDFYSLLNFDCLIRSGESNFSQMAHVAKDYQCVIFPTAYYWEQDRLNMANIHIERNNRLITILNEVSDAKKHDVE